MRSFKFTKHFVPIKVNRLYGNTFGIYGSFNDLKIIVMNIDLYQHFV